MTTEMDQLAAFMRQLVQRLTKGEKMNLMHQLERDNGVQLKEKPQKEKGLAVVTQAQV